MTEKELLEKIQDYLEAQTWTGSSSKVFGTGSVIVTASLAEALKAALQSGVRTPLCLISPSGAESDPEFDEEPDWEKFTFSCLLAVVVPGGAVGQEPLLGANLSGGTGASEGKGILDLEVEFYNAVGKLNALEDVFLQNRQHGEEGGAFHPPSTYIAYRTINLEAWGTASTSSSDQTLLSTAKNSNDQTDSTGTLSNITDLSFSVTSGTTYYFMFSLVFQSDTASIGLKCSVTFPSATTFAAVGRVPITAATETEAPITSSGEAVTGTATPVINTNYLATIEGVITPSASGTLQAQFAAETTGGIVTLKANSYGQLLVIS